jgi:LacI family transcriptional regulator
MALPFGDEAARRLQANGLETILVESTHPFFSSVEIDDRAGGRMVAQYLIERGYRRFGFVGDADVPDYAIHTSERRKEGYVQALHEAGIAVSPAHIALGPHGLDVARRLTERLLDGRDPPTAIFAASDTQALGVLKAARERGITIPDQLAVVGFDDVEIADYIGLTTVRQPLEESGRVAVELLRSRLSDSSRPIQRVMLPLTLVRRETA